MACNCRATILLWYKCTTGVLQWMYVDSLGRQSGVARNGSFRFCERAVELHGVLPLSHEPVDSLWVKIQGQMNRGDIIVDICYRPPKQEEEDETFRQVHNALYLQVLILMRDFSYPTVR